VFKIDKETDVVYQITFLKKYKGQTLDGAKVGGSLLYHWDYGKTDDYFLYFKDKRGIRLFYDLHNSRRIGAIEIHSP
jgi:hypothetical protein